MTQLLSAGIIPTNTSVTFKKLPEEVPARCSKIFPVLFVVIIHKAINYYQRHTGTVYKQLQHTKEKLCRIGYFTMITKQQIWNKIPAGKKELLAKKKNYAGRETASFIKIQAIKCSFVIYTPFLSRNRESDLLFHRVPADGFVTTRLPAWLRLPRQGCWAVAGSGVSPRGSWHCLLSHSLLLFLCFQRADNPCCSPDKQESGPGSTPIINATVAGSLPVFISSAPVPSYRKGSPGNA